jgi:hypothetical protein
MRFSASDCERDGNDERVIMEEYVADCLPALRPLLKDKTVSRKLIGRKALAAAKLLGSEPSMTCKDIASVVGCNPQTVSKINRHIRATSKADDLDVRLEIYRHKIEKRLPSQFKADKLRSVVDRVDNNPFAALKAIQYADQIQGYVRASDMDARAPIAQPLFSLPAGSTIHIEAGRQVCDAAGPNTPSQIPDNVIDITPNSPDSTDST